MKVPIMRNNDSPRQLLLFHHLHPKRQRGITQGQMIPQLPSFPDRRVGAARRTGSRLAAVSHGRTDRLPLAAHANSSARNKEAQRLQRRRQKENKTLEARFKRCKGSNCAKDLLTLVFFSQPDVWIGLLRCRCRRQTREDLSPGVVRYNGRVAWTQTGAPGATHRFLLPPLPAQLSVGCRHGLDHEGGGHVAAGGGRGGEKTVFNSGGNCLCCSTSQDLIVDNKYIILYRNIL